MATAEHREKAQGQSAVCAVLTVSDTRTAATDKTGPLICALLEEAGHHIKMSALVPDEPDQIEFQLQSWLEAASIEVVCITGGTGIARRDTTIEIVDRLLSKPLPGFGELFRMLSFDEVGAAAMLSRATAGLAGNAMVFAMPGSTNAVRLAMTQLIIPELPHLVWERKR